MKAQALASGKVDVAQHRAPQHRRRRPARGHPQPDRRRRQRHRRQPGRSRGHQPGDQGSDGRGHRRRRRRPGGDRAVGLRHFEQPGRIRLSRRQMAVRADRRQGQRRLHARRRRRLGRQRPRQGLQARARRVPGRQGRAGSASPAGSRTRASSRSSTTSPPARRSTASGPPASTTSSSMRWSSPAGPLVPVVGADNAGFVGQLNSVEGLKGAAVTNPGSIGGAGVTLAMQHPRRQEAGRADRARAARALGERDRGGQGQARRRGRSVARSGMAGLDLDPRLDHLHQGPDHRLQGWTVPGEPDCTPRTPARTARSTWSARHGRWTRRAGVRPAWCGPGPVSSPATPSLPDLFRGGTSNRGDQQEAQRSRPAHVCHRHQRAVRRPDGNGRFEEHEVVLPVVVVTELEAKRQPPGAGLLRPAGTK